MTGPETLPPRRGPLVIDLDVSEAETISPAAAPPVPEDDLPPSPAAMQKLARIAGRRRSNLGAWFWGLLSALIGFIVSLWAWRYVTELLATYPILGAIAAVLLTGFVLVCFALALREWLAFARLGRLDLVHRQADEAARSGDLALARKVSASVADIYAARPEQRWAREKLAAQTSDILDADGLLAVTERDLLGPLDQAARREIELAARSLAVVTAVVPLALADVASALLLNLKMIRRIAEIYGGRSGVLGSWRLVRNVLTHIVATGAVAVGDDVVQSVAGGGLLSKVSRRFGEGVVNAALTARVGIAAMEVCRPMPFRALPRPVTSRLLGRALTGVFGDKA